MKTAKRTLALLLTVCLLCSTLFTSAFAAEGDELDDAPVGTAGEEKVCTCEAGEGEEHAETCALYAAPEEEKEEPEESPVEPETPVAPVEPKEPDADDVPAAEPVPLSDEDTPPEVNDPVAKIGEQGYETLSAAITAAGTNKTTIVLQQDTNEDITIPASANIVLDLNGKTLTNNSGDTITVALGATLTIEGTGTVDNKSHGKGAIFNNGTVVLNGGTYDRTSETGESADISGGNSWYTICNHGNMTINSGATVKNTGSFSSMIENGYYNYTDSNSRNGYAEETNQKNPTLTINGGTFVGGLNTVKNDDGGKLIINDGNFSNTTQASVLNWNEATINGGTFEVTKEGTSAVLNGASSSNASEHDKGVLTITGGSFTSNGPAIANSFKDAKPTVTGGTFSSDVKDFVPDGSKTVQDEDGKFTIAVNTDTAVAQIGSAGFDSLAAAVAAAKDGDTVTLLKNDTVNSPLYVNTGIKLDLGQNIVTLKSSIVFANGSSELKNGTITDERSKNTTDGNKAAVFVQNAGTTLKTSDVTIQSYQPSTSAYYNYDLYIKDGATVTLGSGTKISELEKTSSDVKTYGVVGIVVMGTSGTDPTYTSTTNLTIEDGVTIETTGFALSTNGASHGTNITIEGGTLTSKEGTGIYFPSNGKLTISGGEISGVTGIEVRAGEVEVSGDVKIVGTGTSFENGANGNGTTTTGAGIAVVQHTTKLDTKLTVTGGEISGYHAIYESNPQNNSKEDLEKVVISIEDGDFKSTSDENVPIKVDDKTEFVKGGNFSNSIDENTNYLSSELTAELMKSNGETPYSYYNSVEEALENAESGDTITNLKPDDNGNEIKSYTATFDAGNGTTSLENITVPSGTKITLPSASRSGYKFQGWKAGSTTYSAGEEVEITADTTFTAQWKKKSSSSGSSSSSSSKTEIDLDTGKNGDVSVSPKKPGKGDKVTITVEPDDGYILDTIKVTDEDGDKIKLTEKGENKYTFTMPSGEVTIETTFTKADSEDAPKFSFIDVSTGDWFAPAVDYVSAKGMMNGSNGYFSPYDSLTRGMIAQILYNLEGGTGSFAIAYPDVSASDWYANAVSWVSANGIMSGYGSGLFGANDSVTREQLALTLYSYAKVKGYDTSASAELTAFADGASTSEWAKPAMQWAVANGLFSGKTGNRLDPQGTATRAEVASILMRFCETIAK